MSLFAQTPDNIKKDNALSTLPILEVISYETPKIDTKNAKFLILENLSQMPLAVDELLRACHLSIPAVQFALLEMKLAGLIQRLPGQPYRLAT